MEKRSIRMVTTGCLLLALLLPLVAAARVPSEGGGDLGGFKPIKNVTADAHVQDVGKWAVSEYNQHSHKALVFQSVVQGQQQVVHGINYDLLISVKDGSSVVKYEGLVYEDLPGKNRELESFTRK